METPIRLLNENDVVFTSSSALMFQCTFKVSEFLTIMQSRLQEEKLFLEGLDCEILQPSQRWKKGKLRLRLEFCPEESELKDLPEVPEDFTTDQSSFNQPAETPLLPSGNLDGNPANGEDNTAISEATNDNDNSLENFIPLSLYADSNPGSVGMWS